MASHTAQVVYSTVPQNHHAHHLNAVASSSSISQQERLPSIRELPSIRDLNFPFEAPGTQQVNPVQPSSAISSVGRQQRQQQTQSQQALQQQQEQYYVQQPQVHSQQQTGYVQQQPMQQYVQMDPSPPTTSSSSVSRTRPQNAATWTPPLTHPPGPAPSVNPGGQPAQMSVHTVPSADYHHHHSSSIANNISLHHPQHLQNQHSHQPQSPLKRQKPGSSATAGGAGIGGGIGMSATAGTQGAVVSGRASHPGYAAPPSSHGYITSLQHAAPSPYSSVPISSLAVSGSGQAVSSLSSPLPPAPADSSAQPETYDYIPYQQTHPHQSHQQPPQPQQSQSVPQTAASAQYAPGRSSTIPQSAMYSATTSIASSAPAAAEAWHAQQSHHNQHSPTPPQVQQTLPLQASQVVSQSTISTSPASHYQHTQTPTLQHAHVLHQQHQQQPVQAAYSQTQSSPSFSRTAPLLNSTIDPSATAGQVSVSARSSMGSVTSLMASPGPPIAVMPNSSANVSSYATSGASGGSAANVGGSTSLLVGKHEVMEADSGLEESWISKIQSHCMALFTIAERYVQLQHTSPQSQPSLAEVADMTEHALVVVSLLEELKRLSISEEPEMLSSIKMEDIRSTTVGYPPGETRAPKRPWEDISGEDDFVDSKSYVGANDRVQTAAEKDMALIRSKRATNSTALNAGQPKGKYRKRSRATPPGKCHSCNIRETPEWRRGPDGARTLCNACGLHYAKLVRKRDKMGPDVKIDLEMLRASTRAATEKENAAAALASAQSEAQQHVQKSGNTDHFQVNVHNAPPPTSAPPSTAPPSTGASGGSVAIDQDGTTQDPTSLLRTQSQPGQPPPPSSSAPPGSANGYTYATTGSGDIQPPRHQTMVPSSPSHSSWVTGSAQPARAYMHGQQQSFLRSSHAPPSRSTSS